MELRDLLPEPRSVDDVLSKRIRLLIDGEEFVLPVLPIRENRVWTDRLDGEVVRVLSAIEEAGDDVGAVLASLSQAPGRFMDLLLLYDLHGLLPPRERIEAVWTEVDLLQACLEVWRAAHPLVDIGLVAIETTARRVNALPRLTNTPPPNGASVPTASRAN